MKFELCMLGVRNLTIRGSSLYQSMDSVDVMSTSATKAIVHGSTLRRLEIETLTRYFHKVGSMMKSDTAIQIAFDGSSVGKFSDFVVFVVALKNFQGEQKKGSLKTGLVGIPQVALF